MNFCLYSMLNFFSWIENRHGSSLCWDYEILLWFFCFCLQNYTHKTNKNKKHLQKVIMLHIFRVWGSGLSSKPEIVPKLILHYRNQMRAARRVGTKFCQYMTVKQQLWMQLHAVHWLTITLPLVAGRHTGRQMNNNCHTNFLVINVLWFYWSILI